MEDSGSEMEDSGSDDDVFDVEDEDQETNLEWI